MESYYEINVAKHGIHFFATSPKSIKTFEEAEFAHEVLLKRFPKSEGFDITCTHWKVIGSEIKF